MYSANPFGSIALAVLGLLFLVLFIFVTKSGISREKWHSTGFLGKLIVLSQFLVFVCIALVFVSPLFRGIATSESAEEILIIDGSVSMLSETEDESRLVKAIYQAREDVSDAFSKDAKVSVIFAGMSPRFLAREVTKEDANVVYDALDTLLETSIEAECFGQVDIKGAMKFAEEITAVNGSASVTLYTDQTYLNTGKVNVCNVRDVADWNAAILDVRATLVENYYRFEVDVVSYGRDMWLDLSIEFRGVNSEEYTEYYSAEIICVDDEVTTFVLGHAIDSDNQNALGIDQEVAIYSFETIHVGLDAIDSLPYDNAFYLYGGKKPTLKIQYCTTQSSDAWDSALLALQDTLSKDWDIEFVCVDPSLDENDVALEGYDVYIFEKYDPKVNPSDGLVIYSDPSSLPRSTGVNLITKIDVGAEFLTAPIQHPITENIVPEDIFIIEFTTLTHDGYASLLECEGNPLLLVKDEPYEKIVVMPFSLVQSNNIVILSDFPLLFKQMIEYFFPVSLEKHVFETGDTVNVNIKTDLLEVTGPDTTLVFEEFPAKLVVEKPGTYSLVHVPLSGVVIIENIFVRIPIEESNIFHSEVTLENPYFSSDTPITNVNTGASLFYLILAMVALLFLEFGFEAFEVNRKRWKQ